MIMKHPPVSSRTIIARLAASLIAVAGIDAAQAGSFDLPGDTDAQYTLTLGYALAMRTGGRAPALIDGPVDPATGIPTTANGDDGDRNFKAGSLINDRVSALGELFLTHGNVGAVLRGDAFYDDVYHRRNDNDSPDTVNKDGEHDRYTQQARKYDGGRVRLLDAYAWADHRFGSTGVDLRVGRQVVAWGESLFFSGIASAQGPADATKANVPGVEVKNILLPVDQVFTQISFAGGLSLAAYYHLEYQPTELEPAGAYFSTSDVVGPGARLLHVAYGYDIPRGHDQRPSDGGQYGLSLKAQLTGATNLGLYWLRYHDTNPAVLLDVAEVAPGSYAPVSYHIRYFDGIDMAAASFSTRLGAANVAGEVNWRDGATVLVDTALGPTATRGKLVQTLVSSIYTMSPNALSQQIDLVGEAGYLHLAGVDAASGSKTLSNDRDAWAVSGIATLNYRNVFSQWDLALPLTFSLLHGTPALAGAFGSLYGDGDMRASVAGNFTYLQNLQIGASYNAFLGSANAAKRPYADRDYMAINLKYSF
ncbi:DUF1302 domain-containing protein [Solimonas terrae]|uniref:DUF1302 domain-containing protein n=1 Tax=Solimonas terrae TaxID=1396819 RepID=A0A6M2BUA0_9GAMM|nr:DUF1302 family protein [Solimonas terrae]NGY05693.1 DUF1302 domain-containing protein [Solimonas terrae]